MCIRDRHDPGVYRHEKMTSGAYLGEICRLMLRGAAAEGLFSEEAAAKILALEELNSAEADALACGGGDMFTGEDAETAGELCNAVFVRSARCVCSNIAAILVPVSYTHLIILNTPCIVNIFFKNFFPLLFPSIPRA